MMSSVLSYIEEIVPIEKLKEDEEIKSLVPPNNSIEDLEKSLKEKSQIFPLITDKNYVLIDGYTRLAIMRKLEFKEVKILKYDFDSQQERDKAYELIWIFNGARRQLDKNERLALFQKIADRIAKVRASKNKTEESKIVSPVTQFSETEESKIESHATQFSETESKQIEENEEFVELDDGTKISALEYERILTELDKENKALSESDKRKMAILRINAPWLLKYVTDQKYKVPLVQAFKIYTKAKELGILDKLKDLAPALRDPLISTREGRKIILNDEYRDLLEKVLSKQYTTERAISEVKQREASKRGERKKSKAKEEKENENEVEGEEIETIEGSKSDVEEYDFVGEWKKAEEEEKEVKHEQQPPLITQPAEEDHYNKIITEMLSKTSISEIKDKLSQKELIRLADVWKNFDTAFVNLSNYYWQNAVPILIRYLPNDKIEKIFYEFTDATKKFYKWEEIFFGAVDYGQILKKFNKEFYGENGDE